MNWHIMQFAAFQTTGTSNNDNDNVIKIKKNNIIKIVPVKMEQLQK